MQQKSGYCQVWVGAKAHIGFSPDHENSKEKRSQARHTQGFVQVQELPIVVKEKEKEGGMNLSQRHR